MTRRGPRPGRRADPERVCQARMAVSSRCTHGKNRMFGLQLQSHPHLRSGVVAKNLSSSESLIIRSSFFQSGAPKTCDGWQRLVKGELPPRMKESSMIRAHRMSGPQQGSSFEEFVCQEDGNLASILIAFQVFHVHRFTNQCSCL